MKLRHLGVLFSAGSVLLLAACGDDNDARLVPPTATVVPATATRTFTAVPTATLAPATPTNTVPAPPTNTVPAGPSATPTNTQPVPPSATPTLTPTQGTGPAVCGNDAVESGEDCDDGNNWGGDGCAANCTNETDSECLFVGASGATVQTTLFALPLSFSGQQTFTVGTARDEIVETADENVEPFNPGDIPVALKAENLGIEPIMVPGLVCACVRGVPPGDIGVGVSGAGRIGCGDQGLTNVDYLFSLDHNTNDVDPNCERGELEDGSAEHPHAGVCNSIEVIEFSGSGGPGAGIVTSSTSISLIQDGGLCEPQPGNPDFGPDGLPCTDDDPNQAEPTSLATTTGIADSELFDANNIAGKRLDKDSTCGALPCETGDSGVGANCAVALENPAATFGGMKLVSAFTAVDSASIGDNATISVFECAVP